MDELHCSIAVAILLREVLAHEACFDEEPRFLALSDIKGLILDENGCHIRR